MSQTFNTFLGSKNDVIQSKLAVPKLNTYKC